MPKDFLFDDTFMFHLPRMVVGVICVDWQWCWVTSEYSTGIQNTWICHLTTPVLIVVEEYMYIYSFAARTLVWCLCWVLLCFRYKCHHKFSWDIPITPIVEAKAGVVSGFSHNLEMTQNPGPGTRSHFSFLHLPLLLPLGPSELSHKVLVVEFYSC